LVARKGRPNGTVDPTKSKERKPCVKNAVFVGSLDTMDRGPGRREGNSRGGVGVLVAASGANASKGGTVSCRERTNAFLLAATVKAKKRRRRNQDEDKQAKILGVSISGHREGAPSKKEHTGPMCCLEGWREKKKEER